MTLTKFDFWLKCNRTGYKHKKFFGLIHTEDDVFLNYLLKVWNNMSYDISVWLKPIGAGILHVHM